MSCLILTQGLLDSSVTCFMQTSISKYKVSSYVAGTSSCGHHQHHHSKIAGSNIIYNHEHCCCAACRYIMDPLIWNADSVEVPIHSPSASGCGHRHHHEAHHQSNADPNAAGPSSAGGDPPGPNGHYGRATLVICPLVAVIQWRQEIARYVAPNALKVHCSIVQSLFNSNPKLSVKWSTLLSFSPSFSEASHCQVCFFTHPQRVLFIGRSQLDVTIFVAITNLEWRVARYAV